MVVCLTSRHEALDLIFSIKEEKKEEEEKKERRGRKEEGEQNDNVSKYQQRLADVIKCIFYYWHE